MDYLTSQPPEILSLIFKEVHDLNGKTQMLGAVCRALLPYTRQNLYCDVVLESYDQVESFIVTVDSRLESNKNGEYLGSLIESLTLLVVEERPEPDEDDDELSQADGLFLNLKSIKRVSIDSMYFSSILLSTNGTTQYLPKLKHLALLELDGDPQYTLCWKSLVLCPALTSLEISMSHRPVQQEGIPNFFAHQTFAAIPQITSVKLAGFLQASKGKLGDFLRQFTSLQNLTVEGCWNDAELGEIFQNGMTFLHDLSIARVCSLGDGEVTFEELDWDVLAGSNHLTPNIALIIFESNTFSSGAVDFIRHLPHLKKIVVQETFETDRELVSALEELMDPSTKPPQLESIVLNNVVTGSQGKDFSYSHCVLPPKVLINLGWELPDWLENLKFTDAQDLIKRSWDFKVDLSGTLLWAVDVQLEYDRQERDVLMRERQRAVQAVRS